jgi:hypothetical protein
MLMASIDTVEPAASSTASTERESLDGSAVFVHARFVVSFMMPPKYRSTAELPQPKNPALRLREVPAQTLAVIAWRCASPVGKTLKTQLPHGMPTWPQQQLWPACRERTGMHCHV